MRLSEAGKLYLNDYYILKEAERNLIVYLDDIKITVKERMTNMLKEITNVPEHLTLGPYEEDGVFWIWIRIGNSDRLRGPITLRLKYLDVRNTTDLPNPTMIQVTTTSTKARKQDLRLVKKIWKESHQEELFADEYFELDVDSSQQVAEAVFDFMSQRFEQLYGMAVRLCASQHP